MAEHIGADPTCPCRDGLPDPCTLCGEPADGVCQLDTLKGWKHCAEQAEAEVVRLRRELDAATEGTRRAAQALWGGE